MKFSFEHAWAGGRSQASGVFMTALPRNTLAHAGIGHATALMWDGKARTLEEQENSAFLR